MSEYSDQEFEKVKQQIEDCYDKFKKSNFFNELTALEKEESYFVINSFADLMYMHFTLKPEDWDALSIRECCTSILPQKVSAGEEYFVAMPAVLIAFFEFLAAELVLENESELIAAIEDIGPEIIENANNSEDLGVAKSIFKMAEDSGIDIADPEEIDKLISTYNQQMEQENKAANTSNELVDHKFAEVEKNDLCPCGSQEKYKKCCLRKREEQEAYNLAKDRLLEQLLEFFTEIEGDYQFEIADFYFYFGEVMEVEIEDGLERETETLLILMLIFDHELEIDKTVIKLFYEQKLEQLSDQEEEILEECLEISLSPYLVREFRGNNYLLEDVMRKQELILTCREEDFEVGEIIVGRIAKIGSQYQLVGPFNKIPANYKELIIAELEEEFLNYQQKMGIDDLNQFLKDWSVDLFSLCVEIRNLLKDEQEVALVYEAEYNIQSRKLAKNKLLAQPRIKEEKGSEERVDFLIWTTENEEGVAGNFIIDEQKIFFRTHLEDKLETGKNLIKDLLLFTATFQREYRVDLVTGRIIGSLGNRTEEESQQLIEAFINEPLNPVKKYKGKTPLELSRSEKGSKQLQNYIEQLELIANFIEDNESSFFNLMEINIMKEKLEIESESDSVFQDGVEKLLAEKNKEKEIGFKGELIYNLILLWRDYKDEVQRIRGQDRSWAAAVEYLFGELNNWPDTQKEVGTKYGVSANTISKKYRQIAEILEIEL